jgi:hypothetical protein
MTTTSLPAVVFQPIAAELDVTATTRTLTLHTDVSATGNAAA